MAFFLVESLQVSVACTVCTCTNKQVLQHEMHIIRWECLLETDISKRSIIHQAKFLGIRYRHHKKGYNPTLFHISLHAVFFFWFVFFHYTNEIVYSLIQCESIAKMLSCVPLEEVYNSILITTCARAWTHKLFDKISKL